MSFDDSAAREPLFTEKQGAQLLGISASYLRLLRARQKISHYKFGGRIVYALRHIESFKRQHEQSAKAA